MRICTAITVSALLLPSIGAMACAGAPPPTDGMAKAEAEARAAQAVGAERIPKANLQYRLAIEEVEKGRSLMKDDENEAAERMFQRARADAELALELARLDAARSDAASAGRAEGTKPTDVTKPEQAPLLTPESPIAPSRNPTTTPTEESP